MKTSVIFRRAIYFLLLNIFSLQSALASVNIFAQEDDWQTIETEHFNVHFPPELKTWAVSAAHQAEIVREVLKKQQNRVLTEKVDTFVVDPYNLPNGMAMGLSHKPIMILFATPVQSNILPNFSSWQQTLILHEYVHLLHLAQKPRHKWRNRAAQWFDLYDALKLDSERWVAEGYATLLESKLTGRGRLYDESAESFLLQIAKQGALPSYEELNRTKGSFSAGAMAYLVGARYLKWLEDKYSVEDLDSVWTRWFAVEKRDFNQAFVGVFQQSPKRLYQAFVAEYTEKAMRHFRQFESSKATLWMDFKGWVVSPKVSPNGQKIAFLSKNKKQKSTRLNVHSTAENTKALEKFKQKNAKILKRDPVDILDKMPKVFERKHQASLSLLSYPGINNLVWSDDETILFTALTYSEQHKSFRNLHSWNIKTNQVRRLTDEINIRRFDLARFSNQTGHFIIAEKSELGQSQLIKLDLSSDKLVNLTEASLEHIYDFPKISPNKQKLAYLRTGLNQKWRLAVRDLENKTDFWLPLPKDYQYVSFPLWHPSNGNLLFVASQDNAFRLYQYDFATKTLSALTSGEQSVYWPEFLTENKLVYLTANADGMDLYQIKLDELTPNNLTLNYLAQDDLDGTVSKPEKRYLNQTSKWMLPPAEVKTSQDIGQLKPYGRGKQFGTLVFGLHQNTASTELLELGFRSSDWLQKFSWQVNYSQDTQAEVLAGVNAKASYTALPVDFMAELYQYEMRPDRQSSQAQLSQAFDLPPQQSLSAEIKQTGAMFKASLPYQQAWLKFDTYAQYQWIDYQSELMAVNKQQNLILGFEQSWRYLMPNYYLYQSSSADFIRGNTDSLNWQGNNLALGLGVQFEKYAIELETKRVNRASQSGNILSLGGFESNLVSSQQNINQIFSPELAFYSQFGNDYSKHQAKLKYHGFNFFMRQQQLDDNEKIKSVGVDASLYIPMGFTGVSQLNAKIGYAKVKSELRKDDNQFWLSIFHKW
ncbi:TolB family protein [Catenovulum maritimum]|uniref:Dipeptidylpeptidase IV N-terminal domain-containing protein n=1 Tax=Catenovulum maritimum TaxID=1513271 RepID=A0A0J8GQE3_9ALTE|nr:DPP IV N-terminal domain-containing protein [Catenovulum maritimum]KMT64995.1 hypothetical protein XM47_10935 [Catenovulum maritimum]